jgi:predicted YcjX-like family ATPase
MPPLKHLPAFAEKSLGSVAEALGRIAPLNYKSERIAVTGLQRAGKTVFITALTHALLHAKDWPASASPFFPWRGLVQSISLEAIPGIPPFPYEERLKELLGDPPRWPKPTFDLSGLRVRLRYKRESGLSKYVAPVATLDLDLIDYPGEWLLDLPMLSLSYRDWSHRADELATSGRRAELATSWREQANALDPDAAENPFELARVGRSYVDYLKQCRAEHLYYLQPGRFTSNSSGLLESVFFPVTRRASFKAGTNGAALKHRYDRYQRLVRRFYNDVFGRLRRQVVLVDLLSALQHGHDSFADLALAVRSITEAFEELQNPLLKLLPLGRLDRLALVATKADHITAGQINNLVGLLRDMIGEPFVRVNARQSGLLAIASVRATTQVTHKWRDLPMEFLHGVPVGRLEPVAVQPGEIPGQIPEKAIWDTLEFNIRDFAPARTGSAQNQPLPHINLDKVLQFLIA